MFLSSSLFDSYVQIDENVLISNVIRDEENVADLIGTKCDQNKREQDENDTEILSVTPDEAFKVLQTVQ